MKQDLTLDHCDIGEWSWRVSPAYRSVKHEITYKREAPLYIRSIEVDRSNIDRVREFFAERSECNMVNFDKIHAVTVAMITKYTAMVEKLHK